MNNAVTCVSTPRAVLVEPKSYKILDVNKSHTLRTFNAHFIRFHDHELNDLEQLVFRSVRLSVCLSELFIATFHSAEYTF